MLSATGSDPSRPGGYRPLDWVDVATVTGRRSSWSSLRYLLGQGFVAELQTLGIVDEAAQDRIAQGGAATVPSGSSPQSSRISSLTPPITRISRG